MRGYIMPIAGVDKPFKRRGEFYILCGGAGANGNFVRKLRGWVVSFRGTDYGVAETDWEGRPQKYGLAVTHIKTGMKVGEIGSYKLMAAEAEGELLKAVRGIDKRVAATLNRPGGSGKAAEYEGQLNELIFNKEFGHKSRRRVTGG